MSNHYELLRFTLRVRAPGQALPRLREDLQAAIEGVGMIGCWVSEIGPQNTIAVLRRFASVEVRSAERERVLLAGDAFEIGEFVLEQHMDDYQLFPFLAGWRKAAGARTAEAYSQVYAAFYATNGRVPRSLHIWPYASPGQRLDVRTRAVADGVWPPENSAPQLPRMNSVVYLPAPFSPLS